MTPFWQATNGVAHWAYQVTFISYTSQLVFVVAVVVAIPGCDKGNFLYFVDNLYVNSV